MTLRLGRYTLCRRIGVGGMAEVFLAREALEGGGERLCVVKRAHPHLATDFAAIRMFLDEAQLVAQLRHRHIVQIFDLGSVDGAFYIAMEYVPGFDLLTIIQEHEGQQEVIAEQVAARLISQAAQGLEHAHQAVGQDGLPLRVIHRDVSPQNILLSTAGEVKVIDFGVAKASIAKHATQVGIIKGKYPYMSPEQVAGGELDPRTDLYALGLVLYELLTNTRAIAGVNEPQIIENAARGRIAPVRSLRPNLSEGLEQILVRCLEVRPDRRFQSAAELSQALEQHLTKERRRVSAEDCARLLKMVGSDPEVSLEELEAEPLPRTRPRGPITGSEATAVRTSPSYARRTEQAIPSQGAARAYSRARDSGPRTEQEVERITLQATPAILREAVAAKVAGPPAEPELQWPRRSGRALWLLLGALLVAGAVAGGGILAGRGGPELVAPEPPVVPPEPVAVPEPPVVPSEPVAVPEPPMVPTEPVAPGPPVLPPQPVVTPDPPPVKPDPVPTRPVKAAAQLMVDATPPMEIFIDGKRRGRSPLKLDLPPGPHQLEWRLAGEGLARKVKLKLGAGQKHQESWAPRKGTLVVEVVPFGEISVDGKKMGVSSLKTLQLWEGKHTVRAYNEELKRTEERTVEVAPGAEAKTVFKLL